MKINIAASHRFHLLDLARELEQNGHDVRFYSYVPKSRCMSFGLSSKASKSLYYLFLPILAIIKLSHNSTWAIKLLYKCLDNYLSYFMEPCDIYIALGTVYKYSLENSKSKFGALTILEWGSKHIISNQNILAKIPGYTPIENELVERALSGYEIADYIAIPSNHVKDSFLEHKISEQKLIINPYGVDLSMFHPTVRESSTYDLIFVGGWSYRKGCDLLIDLLKKNDDITLLHVGPIVDLNVPNLPNFKHVDAVDQAQLVNYYSKAKIFVLPSREEGLAMVQAQAIACGLPIVCSYDSGGEDLFMSSRDKSNLFLIDDFTTESLERSVRKALSQINTQTLEPRNYREINSLTWKEYGIRYSEKLYSLIKENVQR